MNRPILCFQFGLFLVLSLLITAALAQSDCSAEVAEIEKRIATGNYPDQNVELARKMRETMKQLCTYTDEATRAEMVERILPTKTEEDRRAERKVRSAQAKAERSARKREKQLAEMNKPAVSPVLLAPPTAKSLGAQLVDRDDIMYHAWLWDWDTYKGNLRVLYSSFPDLTQYGLPDWKFHVYVAQMTPAGKVTNHHVSSKQANDHAALALRRGYDEILFVRHVGPDVAPTALERWSISGQRLLFSVDISKLKAKIDSETWRPSTCAIATSDGNLLCAATKGGNSRKDRLYFGWVKISPEGKTLGSDTASAIEDNVSVSSWFHTNNGGGGYIISMTPVDSTDLASGLKIPANEATHASGMTAHVARESRVLIVDTTGILSLTSTAIERDIMPLGQPNVPPPTTMQQIQEQLQGQQQWMDLLTTKYNANRSTSYQNIGPNRVEMVKQAGAGYAFLTRVTANRKLKPPNHGPYLVEFDHSGESNEIYLAVIAEQLELKLTTFAPSPDGRFYLHGTDQRNGDSHVILIDRNGSVLARGHTPNDTSVVIEGIIADGSGVWLFGHAYKDKVRARLWMERLEF
jgi:hypothetical protein